MGKKPSKTDQSGGVGSPPPPAQNKPYKTLARAASASFIEKKSEFIGCGSPADTEEKARAFLEAARREHPQASHICYAYRIGADAAIQRMSDAGEPTGTAGVPLLETIKSRGLVNCVVGVIRYFGGILLGASGLARAYGHACAIALDACGTTVMEPTERIATIIPYSLWDIIKYALKDMPCELLDPAYADKISATLRVRSSDAPLVLDVITNASSGKVSIGARLAGLEAWNNPTA